MFTAVWVVCGALCDFLDGLSARLFNVYSSLGKELDSMADMVTFGLAPAVAVFSFLQLSLFQYDFKYTKYIAGIAFLLTIFSALRLAKFNVDERQTTSFIGLPTPANALFWVSLLIGLEKHMLLNIYIPIGVICLVLVFSFLLVAEIPMFSLKIKSFSWKDNSLVYILLICVIVSMILFGFAGVSLGIIVYIFLSVFSRFATKNKAA